MAVSGIAYIALLSIFSILSPFTGLFVAIFSLLFFLFIVKTM